MAGLRGNQAYLAWSRQTARDTPNTTYARRSPFSGGNIQPSRTVENLSETDANRDIGVSYVSSVGVEGTPEVYGRYDVIDSLLVAALGAVATTGAGPYVHEITPANSLPYLTFLRGIGGTLWEQFQDVQISELTLSAEAGQPLTASFDLMGRKATRLTSEPGSLPALANSAPPTFNDASVTLAGGATALVSSFECTISNNVSTQQTDDFVPYDVVAGQREVTLGFTLVFETLTEYNKFHYGSGSGTTHAGTLATTDANFQFTNGTDIAEFDFQTIAYEEFGVEPDPGGDPIEVDVRARAQRSSSDPVITATITNDNATPWT